MKWLRFIAGIVVFALSPTLAYTHDYRPLLVRVIEEPQGLYLLSWQPSPVLKATDQPLVKLAGAGCKPPQAALAKSHGRERYGKGAANASGMNQEGEHQ